MYARLFKNVLYPFYESTLRGRGTFRYFREYQANQALSADALRAVQWQALSALLRHCHENVPFYRRQWDAMGIEPADIRSLEDFQRLPLLTKQMVKEHYEDLVAVNQRGKTMSKTTGGSTGVPFRFEFTRESHERRTAVAWRGYEWAGLGLGDRSVHLWGTDLGNVPGWKKWKGALHHRAFNRKMLNSFVMTRDNMADYVRAINDFKPVGIVSYVAPLHTLACFIREKGLSVRPPQLIITGAEPLHDFQRQDMEAAFGCPVFNTYGCREFMLIAAECEKKQGLHINVDHLVVETVDAEGRAVQGRSGRVSITDLHNYGMPLLRYLNGDMATLSADSCSCGRHFPLIRSIEGRELDSIRTRQGSVLPGEFFPHLLKDVRGLEAFQVVQESLDGVEILLVTSEAFEAASLDFISAEVARVVGGDFAVRYRFVEEIRLTDAGKRRVTVSRLSPQALESVP